MSGKGRHSLSLQSTHTCTYSPCFCLNDHNYAACSEGKPAPKKFGVSRMVGERERERERERETNVHFLFLLSQACEYTLTYTNKYVNI